MPQKEVGVTEAMAVEAFLLARWQLDGFLGSVRQRVPTIAGQWKELDVVAVGWTDAGLTMRVGEVKVRGTAHTVFALHPDSDVFGWVGDWDWGGFVEAIAALYVVDTCAVRGFPAWTDLAALEVEFVVNGMLEPGREPETLRLFEDVVRKRLRKAWEYRQANPASMNKVRVKITTTLDLVMESIEEVGRQTQDRGARFGDPAMDILRELVRYTNKPSLSGVRSGSASTEQYLDAISAKIAKVFGVSK